MVRAVQFQQDVPAVIQIPGDDAIDVLLDAVTEGIVFVGRGAAAGESGGQKVIVEVVRVGGGSGRVVENPNNSWWDKVGLWGAQIENLLLAPMYQSQFEIDPLDPQASASDASNGSPYDY